MDEGERIQTILDEIIRVTMGLMRERVSPGTLSEYLVERTEELDIDSLKRVLIFLALELAQEKLNKEI